MFSNLLLILSIYKTVLIIFLNSIVLLTHLSIKYIKMVRKWDEQKLYGKFYKSFFHNSQMANVYNHKKTEINFLKSDLEINFLNRFSNL